MMCFVIDARLKVISFNLLDQFFLQLLCDFTVHVLLNMVLYEPPLWLRFVNKFSSNLG